MTGRLASWCMVPVVVLGVLAFVASPARAQTDDDATAEPGGGTAEFVDDAAPAADNLTAPPSSPTVYIDLEVRQILAIDERNSRFEVDAVLTAQWVDDRGLDGCKAPQVHHGESASELLKTTRWAPPFAVVAGREPRQTKALELSVSCEGVVQYQERFTVAVTQRFTNLNDFPFDDHLIRFQIAPFGRHAEAIEFAELPPAQSFAIQAGAGAQGDESQVRQKADDKLESEEWIFDIREPVVHPGSPNPPPSITASIEIRRETFFYWMNIIAPLLLIVSISWIVFWMKPVLHERLGVSITILLTVVAFDFLTGNSLPRLSFTTRIDQFYNVSYLFVGLTIVVSLLASRRADHERTDDEGGENGVVDGVEDHEEPGRERRDVDAIDRFSRYAFPPAYATVVVLVIGFGFFSQGREDALRSDSDVTAASEAEERFGVTFEALEENAADLGSGETLSAEIEESGDVDSYRVCVSGADDGGFVVMERVAESELDPFLDLYTIDGAFVTSDDDGAGGLNSLVVLPPEEACYILVATDLSMVASGGYTLRFEPGEPPVVEDELAVFYEDVEELFGVTFESLADDAADLGSGETLSAELKSSDDVDSYRVCVSGADDGGFVVMERDAESELDPFLVLYTEGGSFVSLDDDGAGGLNSLVVLPPAELCYILVASDRSGAGAGEYRLRFGTGEPPVVDEALLRYGVTFETLAEDAIHLEPDSRLPASIEEPLEVASYRVCASGSDGAFVRMEAIGDELDPLLEMYTDDGSFVASDDDGAGGLDSLIELPPGDGCFIVVASDATRTGTGEYMLVTGTQ